MGGCVGQGQSVGLGAKGEGKKRTRFAGIGAWEISCQVLIHLLYLLCRLGQRRARDGGKELALDGAVGREGAGEGLGGRGAGKRLAKSREHC